MSDISTRARIVDPCLDKGMSARRMDKGEDKC
jgi:hypothetical protein